jgi:hypothetical protein
MTLEFFGGTYVPSGMDAYASAFRPELSQDTEIDNASRAGKAENFIVQDAR